ncbi:MAG: DUF58 domain-containing protein [Staphylothermus sp.]|nr:DUF58 domain-containing protein [Staphylothermus sp.]
MVSPNSATLYYYGVVIVSLMALVIVSSFSSILYLLPLFIIVLPILMRGEGSLLLSIYVLIVLSLFYSSLNTYLVLLLFVLAPIIIKLAGNYCLTKSQVALGGFGSLSLSTIMVLKFLVVSSLAALLNYHIVLSISVFTVSVLLYALFRYIGLLRVSLNNVEYPNRIYYGEEKEIRISVSSGKRVLLSISSGDMNRVYWVEGEAVLGIDISSNVLGRKEFMLRMIVYDDTLCVRRVLAEIPVVIYVVPSYEKLLEYSRKNILARIDVRRVLEPVEARAYFLGGEEGVIKVSGSGELASLLAGLPLYIRYLLRGLLRSYFEGITYEKPMGRMGRGGLGGGGKTDIGEYYGTRIFVPGDKLRDIHWKKTVSRKMLYVKEYVSGSSSDLLGVFDGRGPVIILDLGVRGFVEFDKLVKEFLRLLVVSSTKSPFAETSIVVVVGCLAVFLHGKLVDVLNAFTNALIRSSPKIIYEYEAVSSTISMSIVSDMIKYMNESSLVRLISHPCITYSRRIIRLLIENNVLPSRNIAIIHGSPSVLKNAFLKYFLENSGYNVEVMGVVNE